MPEPQYHEWTDEHGTQYRDSYRPSGEVWVEVLEQTPHERRELKPASWHLYHVVHGRDVLAALALAQIDPRLLADYGALLPVASA